MQLILPEQVILRSKQDILEELATLKRTTYPYGKAVNELWERSY